MKEKVFITPLFKRVLIWPDEIEKVTPGGILIPDAHKERTQQGIIVSVGSECKAVKIGQRVVFGKYSGMYITDPRDDKEYIIINEEDLVGYLNIDKAVRANVYLGTKQ